MVAELVGNWATPQGMALVPLLAADPPMLPVYWDDGEQHFPRPIAGFDSQSTTVAGIRLHYWIGGDPARSAGGMGSCRPPVPGATWPRRLPR
jgi:hypothetical protein